MGVISNAAKAGQLGMPFGTASNRLRKLLLFDLLKRHGENECFRCREPIETADELSIEHKEPWLHVDPALFWDLRNVAFSHLRCNVPSRYPGGQSFGETNGSAKLTAAKVQEIRERQAAGESAASLGREYGVSSSVAAAICRGEAWRLTEPEGHAILAESS